MAYYFTPSGKPLFSGTSGASPWNAGTAPGSKPKYDDLAIGLYNQGLANFNPGTGSLTYQATGRSSMPGGMPFLSPFLSKILGLPASSSMRRRQAGSAGVGSTFLTGNSGVRGQTLGYNTLLGS